jgi:SPP1 family predicted phage head-tail adaptor
MSYRTDNAGKLDRRITLQYPTYSRNAVGESVRTWVNAANVWASWLPQGGREFRAALSWHADATGIFRIRHRTDITQEWRVVHGDDTFEVIVPQEIDRRCYIDLIVRAIDQSPAYGSTVEAAVDAELLHDGSEWNLHDGSLMLLHDSSAAAASNDELLEDGTAVLLHDGSSAILEAA